MEQEHLPGSVLVLKGPWRPELAEQMRHHGAQFIRLSQSMGWKPEELSFLQAVPDLRGVEVYHPDVKDLSVLYEVAPKLELVGLNGPFKLDFARFPQLKMASVSWRPGCDTLLGCETLRFLFIEGALLEDFRPLAMLDKLERLFVRGRKLRSLEGADRLVSLRHLTFAYCASLEDISAISALSTLEVFEADCCTKVNDLSPFSSTRRLRKLLLEECGRVASVKPLERLEALEELYLIGTHISDGDLSPLRIRSLKRVAIAQHRGHSSLALSN